MFESLMKFLMLKVTISVCEFVCQFHKDSHFQFEREENEVPDSDESDIDNNR